MAKNTTVNPHDTDGWETEQEESAIKVDFDTVGDVFTGIKNGQRTVEFTDKKTQESKEFVVYQFRAHGMEGLEDGTLCDIQESFKLKGLANIPDGKLVRITRMADVDVNQPAPMKDYRIQSKSV